jgi:WD40 repeat protein
VAKQVYDGFISYSHAADGLLAPRLQAGLQRFAKPWWKRRAVRIFRDESSLSANPHLWTSITDALDASGWFVLLLSPDAARSEWVNQEIAYWKNHRDASRILPVVTAGEFGWTHGDVAGDAVPEQLRGVFEAEPRWVDLRFARGDEQLDLTNPRFSAAVADIASALRGVPKDELESEEVNQHRRTIRTAWAGAGLIAALAISAVGFGIASSQNAAEAERQTEIAVANADEADRQAGIAEANAEAESAARAEADDARLEAEQATQIARSRELATAAIAVVDQDPELATLLAIEAVRTAPSESGLTPELASAMRLAGSSNRLADVVEVPVDEPGSATMALSRDGSRLVVASEYEDGGWLGVYSTDDLEAGPIWERFLDVETIVFPKFSDDGSRLGVAFGPVSPNGPPFPQGILVVDGSDGSEVARIEYPDCVAIDQHAWSPDGSYLVVGVPPEPCARMDSASPIWAEVFETQSWTAVGLIEGPEGATDLKPDFDGRGRLILSGINVQLSAWDPSGPTPLGPIGDDVVGLAAGHPTGPFVATFSNQRDAFALRVYDIESGELVDRVPLPAFPTAPAGMEFSLDGLTLVVGTTGGDTLVLDAASGVTLLSVPADSASTVALDTSRERLYTSHRGQVKVWDVGTATFGVEVLSTIDPSYNVNANTAAVGPEMSSVSGVVATQDGFRGFSFLLDSASGRIVDELEGGSQVEWLADGRLVYPRTDGVLVLRDPATGEERQVGGCVTADFMTCESGESYEGATAVTWDDPAVMALVTHGGRVRYMDSETLETLREFDLGSDNDRYWETVGGNEDWLIAILDTSLVAVDAATGAEAWRKDTRVDRGEISRDGRFAAFQTDQSGLLLVRTDTWEEFTIDAEFGDTRGLEFSPNGTRLALGDDRQIWREPAGRADHPPPAHFRLPMAG